MAKEFLSIRCSEDILKAIKEREVTGKSRTEIVESLLRTALGLEPSENEVLVGIAFEERVKGVVQSVVQRLEERLEALEKSIA